MSCQLRPVVPPFSLTLFLALFFLLAILAAPALAQEETPVSPTLDPNAGGRACQAPDRPAVTPMQTEVTLLSKSFDGETFPPEGWQMGGDVRDWRTLSTRGTDPAQIPHSGAGEAMFHCGYHYKENDRPSLTAKLLLPSLDFSLWGTYQIPFWMYHTNTVCVGQYHLEH